MGNKKKTNSPGGGLDLKDRTGSKKKIQKPKKYKCVMHNDDYTPMDFVVAVLVQVFHKPAEEAIMVMLDVHKKGKGIAGVYSKEIAETKKLKSAQYAAAAGHPFLITIEPE